MLKVLDLFSGIGGISLGLHKAGMSTTLFCERDEYCRGKLNKIFPGIPVYSDITTLVPTGDYQVVCGGFPCQDISVAGNKKGIQNGTRSGLWFEYKRIIEATQPKYVIIENVRELLNNGLTRVLQDIHHLGYDAEWSVIASTSAGLPNKRERVWIVAYPRCFRRNVVENTSKGRDIFCYVYRNAAEKEKELKGKLELWARSDAAIHGELSTSFWETQFGVCGVVDGLPKELSILEDKALKAYGNSVCPEIPYLIGKRIMEIESA